MSQKENLTVKEVIISEPRSRLIAADTANRLTVGSFGQVSACDIVSILALASYGVGVTAPAGVFLVGQNLQVNGIGAKANVAEVINLKAFRYFANQVLVNVPMGTRPLDRRRAATVNLKFAVAGGWIRRASPKPARRSLEKAFTANSYLGDISLKC